RPTTLQPQTHGNCVILKPRRTAFAGTDTLVLQTSGSALSADPAEEQRPCRFVQSPYPAQCRGHSEKSSHHPAPSTVLHCSGSSLYPSGRRTPAFFPALLYPDEAESPLPHRRSLW